MKKFISALLVFALFFQLLPLNIVRAETLAITKQPVNVTVAEGETAKTSVTATGDGLKYQWYYANKGATTFSKASITSATYTVEMTASRSGRRIYCVVTDESGNKVTSDTVTLTMATPVKITKQPTDVTVASGETAKTSVTATGDGLKYQWYYANKGATTFSKASITSATYTVEMTASRSGRRIYCVITDKYGNKATSNTVTLTVENPLKITKQPTNVTVASGETAKTSVTATGDGLKYQWYYANKGATTFSKASITSDTYTVGMTASRSGRRIYCVITDKYGNKVTSNTVTLYTSTPLKITKQPTNVTIASGKTASTSVTATGDGLKYQWYYKNATGTKFSKATVTTATYSVTMNDTRDGRQIYCVVTDKYGNKVTSDTVTLSMPWAIRITQQPTDVETYEGTTIETKVVAEGDGLKYRWYYANKGSTTFSKSSITSDTYTVEMTASRSGRRIYCLVTDQYGQKIKTNVVTLTALEGVLIPDGLEYGIMNEKVIITDYTGIATHLAIPAEIEGYPVASIGNSAFHDCASLTSITIPSSVTSIGTFAFSDCVNLTSITIPSSVTSIKSGAFWYCQSLTNITFPSGITSIEADTFYECSSLTSITLPSGVTTIGDFAFRYCKSLTNITIPNSVTSIGKYAFDGCKSLTNITIPSSVTSIGSGAFASCDSFTNITLPNSITSIESFTFQECSNLTSVTLPSNITSIGSNAFSHCYKLKSIIIPNSVTSIGDWAFGHCYDLTNITIPSSVTSIGEYCFYASALSSITIPSSVTSIGENAFDENTTIKVKNKSYAHQWCLENGFESMVQIY